MDNTCGNCSHWKPNQYGDGECEKIREELDIIIDYGWDGGYIEGIDTPSHFGCNLYKGKNEE